MHHFTLIFVSYPIGRCSVETRRVPCRVSSRSLPAVTTNPPHTLPLLCHDLTYALFLRAVWIVVTVSSRHPERETLMRRLGCSVGVLVTSLPAWRHF